MLIGDDGRGIYAGPESRGLGLGLALMSEVCDDFSVVERPGDGTELQLRFKIRATERRGVVTVGHERSHF